MTFAGLNKDEDIANVIAYLKTFDADGNPVAGPMSAKVDPAQFDPMLSTRLAIDVAAAAPNRGRMRGDPRSGRRSGCSSPAWSTSSARRSASPRSKLLEEAGCDVEVPPAQTCCGQPAYNSGDRDDTARHRRAGDRRVRAVRLRRRAVGLLRRACSSIHYAELFADDPAWRARAEAFGAKVYELISFLVDVRGMSERRCRASPARSPITIPARACASSASATSRGGCSRSVAGLKLTELHDADVCCGFGGTFCVKYPDISNAIVEKKTAAIAATGAGTLLAGDLGCLMNMAGKLQRQDIPVHTRHVAEVLAGMTDTPPIGETG